MRSQGVLLDRWSEERRHRSTGQGPFVGREPSPPLFLSITPDNGKFEMKEGLEGRDKSIAEGKDTRQRSYCGQR